MDTVAERYLETFAALDPCAATEFGIAGHDDDITDYSPAGVGARADAARAALRELAGVAPVDDVDRVTVAAMQERLGVAAEMHDAGLDLGELNVIASPLQTMRDVFDLMPTDTEEDWALIARRLAVVPRRVDDYAEGLRAAAAAGRPPAVRQVARGIEYADRTRQLFVDLAARAPTDNPALSHDLNHWGAAAAEAYRRLAEVLRGDIASRARAADAFGRDAYQLLSRAFLGSAIDLDDAYAWGLQQLESIVAEEESVAEQLYPGSSVGEAMDRLDSEERYHIEGTENLRTWMQSLSDHAVASLADKHFDIALPLRRLECRIAPTQTGGIYYTGPSEDLSRPGRMWWSVPSGVTTFHTWRETTTVFHEGVPGHHLQIGRAVVLADELNRWRRLGCWVSGHGEGWALYAERLMDELGSFERPEYRLGFLSMQALRAARVVVDIGLHTHRPIPLGRPHGGEAWSFEVAVACIEDASGLPREFCESEVLRYLAWPTQATCYKLGERVWLAGREHARRRGGERFDPKTWHASALALGPLGIDDLADELDGLAD